LKILTRCTAKIEWMDKMSDYIGRVKDVVAHQRLEVILTGTGRLTAWMLTRLVAQDLGHGDLVGTVRESLFEELATKLKKRTAMSDSDLQDKIQAKWKAMGFETIPLCVIEVVMAISSVDTASSAWRILLLECIAKVPGLMDGQTLEYPVHAVMESKILSLMMSRMVKPDKHCDQKAFNAAASALKAATANRLYFPELPIAIKYKEDEIELPELDKSAAKKVIPGFIVYISRNSRLRTGSWPGLVATPDGVGYPTVDSDHPMFGRVVRKDSLDQVFADSRSVDPAFRLFKTDYGSYSEKQFTIYSDRLAPAETIEHILSWALQSGMSVANFVGRSTGSYTSFLLPCVSSRKKARFMCLANKRTERRLYAQIESPRNRRCTRKGPDLDSSNQVWGGCQKSKRVHQ